MEVAQVIGQAQMTAFSPTRVGLIIAGLEVPHTHLHIIPIDSEADLSFSKADPSPEPAALDDAAERLRQALRAMGRAEVPSSPSARPQKRALRRSEERRVGKEGGSKCKSRWSQTNLKNTN